MRKIVLNLAVTLDGFIAGPNGEYDWCLTDADYGMTDFLKSLDATIMGGKSYRLLLEYGPPYPEFTNYVITRTEKSTPFANVEFVSSNVISIINELKRKPGKDIWLFGGSEITDMLLQHDLIDEFILSVHPLLLGAGLPLFKNSATRRSLKLLNSIPYPSGLVQLIYAK